MAFRQTENYTFNLPRICNNHLEDKDMFDLIITYLPTILAIAAMALFSPKTRWLCYAIVALAIISESLITPINLTALIACISVFVGLIIEDVLHRYHQLSWNDDSLITHK